MTIIEPPYKLIRTRVSEIEWRFEESQEAWAATDQFDAVLEKGRATGKLSPLLREFLKKFPWHFDALTHYAMCKRYERKFLDAYAYARTAVGTAKEAFPDDFDPAGQQIPGGFVENRPFLRALHELMQCRETLGDNVGASKIGYEILSFDVMDRMGARTELPKYLLRMGRYQKALELFESPEFEGTFHRSNYLLPLVLLHIGRREEAIKTFDECLHTPQTARYLLNPMLPMPPSDSPFGGVTSGSELEGYFCAQEYRPLYFECDEALNLLIEASKKVEKAGWPRYFPPARKLDDAPQ